MDLFPTSYENFFTNASGIALMVAALIVSVSYMVGKFFSMPSVEGFSKVELSELAVTAIIIIISLSLLTPNGAFDAITKGFTIDDGHSDLTQTVCPEWAAQNGPYNSNSRTFDKGNLAFGQAGYFLGCKSNFLDGFSASVLGSWKDALGTQPAGRRGVMLPRIMDGYIRMTWYEVMLSMVYTMDFSVSFKMRLISFNVGGIMPFTGKSLLSEANIFILDAMMTVLTSFIAQNMLLKFLEVAMPHYFLPIGLMMRAIPFFRKTGSTIIAVCFAAYFVYPITILLNQHIFNLIQNPQALGPEKCAPDGTGYTGKKCTANSECCSEDCRNGKCSSPMTDFYEYESTFAICQGQGNMDKISDVASDQKAAIEARIKELEALEAQGKYNAASQSAEARLRERLANAALENKAHNDFLSTLSKGGVPVISDFFNMITAAKSTLKASIIDISRYVVFALLSLVVEIVVTLTLLKDFALLIGGEPRIFGISKMV